jgi:hypothetical protein
VAALFELIGRNPLGAQASRIGVLAQRFTELGDQRLAVSGIEGVTHQRGDIGTHFLRRLRMCRHRHAGEPQRAGDHQFEKLHGFPALTGRTTKRRDSAV